MKRNEIQPPKSVNLFPVAAICSLTMLGVLAALVMLWGLHNKIPKASKAAKTVVSIDEIGAINLDNEIVRINLMVRNKTGNVEKLQEVKIPLENFARGYERLKSFMDRTIEKGVLVPRNNNQQ